MIERCKRSTLLETDDGRLYRRYHDTDAVSSTFPAHVDASGNRRCSGNRRIDALRRDATFRGSGADSVRRPPHLHGTLALVCRRPRHIETVAQQLDVSTNTAWSYVCRVVELWPTSWDCARRLVDDDLMRAVDDEVDLRGSLRELMARLPPRASQALRESSDRYAHLRLARLCAEARRELGKNAQVS